MGAAVCFPTHDINSWRRNRTDFVWLLCITSVKMQHKISQTLRALIQVYFYTFLIWAVSHKLPAAIMAAFYSRLWRTTLWRTHFHSSPVKHKAELGWEAEGRGQAGAAGLGDRINNCNTFLGRVWARERYRYLTTSLIQRKLTSSASLCLIQLRSVPRHFNKRKKSSTPF